MLSRILRCCLVLLCLGANGCDSGGEEAAADPIQQFPWKKLSFPEAEWRHDDAFFLDRETGWVASTDAAEIHKTVDGGETWSLQLKPDGGPYFRCIAFHDQDLGFACNLTAQETGNPLFRTTDGGETWSVADIDPRVEGLCGISIVNASTIYAAGKYEGPAYVVKSRDGGLTWAVTDMNDRLGQAVDIHFFNERDGVLIGGSDSHKPSSRVVVLTTSDGGETWVERHRGSRLGEFGWKISFPSREVGYVSIDTEGLEESDMDFFLKTEDGGLTWTRKPFYPGLFRAQGIGFATEQVGWIGSFLEERPTMGTSDGGESWSEIEPGAQINRFRFNDDGTGIASGRWLFRIDRATSN